MNLFYFAYASNLNIAQMAERKVSWRTKKKAILPGYMLAFNVYSLSYGDHSVANVVKSSGAIVEGLLYELDNEESFAQLDTFEKRYERKEVRVTLVEEEREQKTFIYLAKPEFIVDNLPPASAYLERIFTGGKEVFSEEYKNKLKSLLVSA